VVVSTTEKSLFYRRYGVPVPGLQPQWYGFDHDPATGLGALPFEQDPLTGRTGTWVLHLQDGVIGSNDYLTGNGTVVDPGGPANGAPPGPATATTTTTPSTTTLSITAAPTAGPAKGTGTALTASATGSLPVTGADSRALVVVGRTLLAVGTAIRVVTRLPRRGRRTVLGR
jgi:hypothetical protein